MDTVLLKTLTFTANWGTSIDGDELGARIALDIAEGRVNVAEVHLNTTTNITGGTKSNLEAWLVPTLTEVVGSDHAVPFQLAVSAGTGAVRAFTAAAANANPVAYVATFYNSRCGDSLMGSYLTFTHDEDRDAGAATVTVKLRGTPRQYNWMKTETPAA